MIEHVEVFRSHIELDALSQVKTAAQREVGLVDGVRAAQAVPEEVASLTDGWRGKGCRIQCSAARLCRISNPIGLAGHDVSLSSEEARHGAIPWTVTLMGGADSTRTSPSAAQHFNIASPALPQEGAWTKYDKAPARD